MTRRRRIIFMLMTVLLLAALAVYFIHSRIHRFDQRITTVAQAETSNWTSPRVAIVFGAGIYSDGRPSAMLEDRVRAAADLYKAGKVDRILVSGDNRFVNYNEPKAMREYLITHAVAEQDVIMDFAGRSTYETCVRAREIFGVQRALLVTQRFHLPRAMYLANSLGLEVQGIEADRLDYGLHLDYQQVREIGAEIKAFFNVHGFPPNVVLGDKLPIE